GGGQGGAGPAAPARWDDERPLVRCGVSVRRRSAPAEIAAVAHAARELLVEPVGRDEVDRAWISVDADRGVVPTQHVVGARLGPELTNESWIVDDIAETRDSATAGALQLAQCAQELSERAARQEVCDP